MQTQPRGFFSWENPTPTGSNGPGDRDGGLIYTSIPPWQRPGIYSDNTPGTREAADIVLADLPNIHEVVAGMEDFQIGTMANLPGEAITGYEVKILYSRMQISFNNDSFGAGRGGRNDLVNNTVTNVSVNQATLAGYIAASGSAEAAVRYLIFHEIAHNTVVAKNYENQKWAEYLSINPSDTAGANYFASPQFAAVERTTNNIAFAISLMTGAGMWESPPFGIDM